MIKVLKRLFSESGEQKNYLIQLILIVIIGVLNSFSSIALGFLTQGVLELTFKSVLWGFGVYIALSLSGNILDWFRTRRQIVMVERIRSRYRQKTAKSLLNADVNTVQSFQTGDLLSRANNDATSAGGACDLVVTLGRNVIVPLIIIIVMIVISWKIGIVFLLSLIPVVLYPKLTGKSTSGIGPWRVAFAAMTSETQDLITQRTLVKSYRIQEKANEWADEKIQDYRRKGFRGLSKMYIGTMPSMFVHSIPLIACSVVGAILALQGTLSIQNFVASFLLGSTATSELHNLPNIYVNMPGRIESAKRIFEIWDLLAETSGKDTKFIDNKTVVEFNNISFRYSNVSKDTPPVLNGLSFTVKSGEKVALVGPSGCGKSTALKLVTGIYRPESGEIKLWGRDMDDWDTKALRSNIAMMQQETFLFDSTVRENIACAKDGASESQIESAAERAQVLDWIKEQPEGWDAPTGERGSFLSGGLRQRVGLARLFLKDAPLLILDEATSALDTINENEILKNLSLDTEKTELIVAHRMSAITQADRILVLDGGRVAEEGTHEALLEANGLYARLYLEQEEEGENDE